MSDQATRAAEQFGAMQRKIAENAENGFAGAVVIFGPDGSAVEWLMVGSAPDPALFWGTVHTQVNIRMQELKMEAERSQTGWGGGQMIGPGRSRL